MKNKEKYIDELIDLFFGEDEGTCCAFIKKHLNTTCEDYEECNSCNEKVKAWLEQEYIEKPRLSHDEYIILKNVDKDFGWLARNKDSLLIVTSKKPHKKEEEEWYSYNRVLLFILFQHLFQFIKWGDEEPYNIRELLEEYESYHSDN